MPPLLPRGFLAFYSGNNLTRTAVFKFKRAFKPPEIPLTPLKMGDKAILVMGE